MSIATLNDIFFAIVDRARERVMMHRQAIAWVPISSQELYRNVAGVSHAFDRWGIGKGDRVAILSENRPEWTITDFACQLLGIVSVPIYSTLTAEQANIGLTKDGKPHLDVKDDSFKEPGKVGLWTKADAVSNFDELVILAK